MTLVPAKAVAQPAFGAFGAKTPLMDNPIGTFGAKRPISSANTPLAGGLEEDTSTELQVVVDALLNRVSHLVC